MFNDIDKLFPKDLYHSYVVVSAPSDNSIEKIISFLEVRGEVKRHSGDIFYKFYESFKIEDSHLIKEWHSRLGIGGLKKICIIAALTINREAMETLLKVIEEPAKNTHFFIIIPDTSILIDTILSRVHIVNMPEFTDSEIIEDVKKFIKANYKDRFDQIAKIVKDNKGEDGSGSLRYYSNKFILELENIYYRKFKDNFKDKKVIKILDEIKNSKEYLKASGSSVKMILENLAIMI